MVGTVEQLLVLLLFTVECVCVCQYELLFCVGDSSDAAIMVVNSLIEKYPQVNARLFAGGQYIRMQSSYDFVRRVLLVSVCGRHCHGSHDSCKAHGTQVFCGELTMLIL